MNTFIESDLRFEFPENWSVRKFDQTAAYRSLSGFGLKGVDFLCLAPAGDLWLVEVKNFQRRLGRAFTPRRGPDHIAKQVGKKFVDTGRLIRLMDRAMQRRWYGRLLWLWSRLWGGLSTAGHYGFWAEANRRVADPRRVVCLLWLELPDRENDYLITVRDAVEEELEPGVRLVVAGSQTGEKLPFSVTPKAATL
ncbi:hypothetical protein [Lewinella sp. IMCC34191]|uniref:hypothetical protein n=1 Tax=Lewinella sp. IMCC34191 TaxID=2259172 RepID=UPI000E23F568|nr:hypothetical protein [Lewinella sp. IMCC34191]